MYQLCHKNAQYQLLSSLGIFNLNPRATCTPLRLTLLSVSPSSQPFAPKATWKQAFGQMTCFSSNLFKQAQSLPNRPKSLNYCVKVTHSITGHRVGKKKKG